MQRKHSSHERCSARLADFRSRCWQVRGGWSSKRKFERSEVHEGTKRTAEEGMREEHFSASSASLRFQCARFDSEVWRWRKPPLSCTVQLWLRPRQLSSLAALRRHREPTAGGRGAIWWCASSCAKLLHFNCSDRKALPRGWTARFYR
jgi:hypothetical protein